MNIKMVDQTQHKLMELIKETGYNIMQHNGQRKFGPPPGWTGPPPVKGCEVFVGKLPREIFEDELVPLFSRAGKIYEMRLMMDFSGSNRGYAFVTYTTRTDASKAVRLLDGYQIRPRRSIGVIKSVDNCRLFVGNIPNNKNKEQILEELSKRVTGIVDVILYRNCIDRKLNRGFVFVEFNSHRDAAMARRALVPGCVKLWDQEVTVDWAEPEPDIDDEQMKKVKVLYVRNFEVWTTAENIKKKFESAINNKIDRIKKIYDYAFIHFYQREHAELAMSKLQNVEIDGVNIEIRWAKPVDRDLYKIQKLNRGNAKFNGNNLNLSQTMLLYKQHLEKKEYTKSPKDEGFGSACAGDSPCCSPTNYKPTYQCTLAPCEYPLAPAKLESMCRSYKWMVPVYSYQKYMDANGAQLWVCSVELPQVGLPLLSAPGSIGPVYTRPCFSYQQANVEAAEMMLHMLMKLKIEPVQPPPPVYPSGLPPMPSCVSVPYNYMYSQTQPVLPVSVPTIWSNQYKY